MVSFKINTIKFSKLESEFNFVKYAFKEQK